MNRFSLHSSISVATACVVLLIAPPVARAENPLERLHRHIMSHLFGWADDHDNRDRDRKKSKHKDDDYDRYERPRVTFGLNFSSGPDFDDRQAAEGYAESSQDRDSEEAFAPREPSLTAEVQSALRHEGFYRGPIDGELTSETRAAIRDYQLDRHLNPTGRISVDLVRELNL